MNSSLADLQSKGFVAIPYPTELRQAVADAQKHWEAFCSLPEDIKRSFPYSKIGAGVGYEDKRVTGDSADLKEDFDLTLGDIEWLEERAAVINNEAVSNFVKSASKVAELITPSIVNFAEMVEKDFDVEGFKAEVEASKHAYFIRFIHYFPGASRGQETAEAHTDQSGMTPHLFESAAGLEYLTHDGTWELMPVSHGEMIIIPSMQLQLRSKGKLKATVHRVIATQETIEKGRYSAVCFVQFAHTQKYDRSKGGRLQEAHKKNLGFNYQMPHEEFAKLFK